MSLTALIFVSLIIRVLNVFSVFVGPLFWGGVLSSYFTVFVKQMLFIALTSVFCICVADHFMCLFAVGRIVYGLLTIFLNFCFS